MCVPNPNVAVPTVTSTVAPGANEPVQLKVIILPPSSSTLIVAEVNVLEPLLDKVTITDSLPLQAISFGATTAAIEASLFVNGVHLSELSIEALLFSILKRIRSFCPCVNAAQQEPV